MCSWDIYVLYHPYLIIQIQLFSEVTVSNLCCKLTEMFLDVFVELLSIGSSALASSESFFPTDETVIPLSLVSIWELSLWDDAQSAEHYIRSESCFTI